MPHHQADVVGTVTYREGDGVDIVIPPGACELEVTELDVTITWVEGDTHGSAAMPLADYSQYVASGALKLR